MVTMSNTGSVWRKSRISAIGTVTSSTSIGTGTFFRPGTLSSGRPKMIARLTAPTSATCGSAWAMDAGMRA